MKYKKFLLFQILVIITLLFMGCDDTDDSVPAAHIGPTSLFVANMSTLSVINLETGDILNDAFGLGIAPNDVLYDGNLLIVVNSSSNNLNFRTPP